MADNLDNYTGVDLKIALARKHQKPSELAEYLGMSRAAVSHWFKGQPIPKKHYERIAMFLDAPIEKDTDATGVQSIYELILSMTKDQKINVIQFILGTL